MDKPDISQTVVSEVTRLQLPSNPDLIESAVEFLRHKAVLCGACHEARSGKLLIALHEGLTNAIVHGNLEISSELKEREDNSYIELLQQRMKDPYFGSRIIDIVVDYQGDHCRWIITDQGKGFDVEAVLAKTESNNPEDLASGRGLLMMRSFMDDVRYEMGGTQLVLTLDKESGKERRQQERVPINSPLQIAPVINGQIIWEQAYPGVARNISQEGICMIQHEENQVGHVVIEFQDQPSALVVSAEVRFSRTLGGNLVELGCRFEEPVDDQNLQQFKSPEETAEGLGNLIFLNQVVELPGEERRGFPRVLFNDRIQIIVAADKPPLVGYPRDLSHSGISFLTSEDITGEVTLIFSVSANRPPLLVRTNIVRCMKIQEGFYDAAGQFLFVAEGAMENHHK